MKPPLKESVNCKAYHEKHKYINRICDTIMNHRFGVKSNPPPHPTQIVSFTCKRKLLSYSPQKSVFFYNFSPANSLNCIPMLTQRLVLQSSYFSCYFSLKVLYFTLGWRVWNGFCEHGDEHSDSIAGGKSDELFVLRFQDVVTSPPLSRPSHLATRTRSDCQVLEVHP